MTLQLLLINAGLVIFDIVWCVTMSNVWAGKPVHNERTWRAFDNIRTFTLLLSVLNILLRVSSLSALTSAVRGRVLPVHDREGVAELSSS